MSHKDLFGVFVVITSFAVNHIGCAHAATVVEDSAAGIVWTEAEIKPSRDPLIENELETTLILGIDPERVDWDLVKEVMRQVKERIPAYRLTGYVIILDGVKYPPEDYYKKVTPVICNVRMINGDVAWGDCDETTNAGGDVERSTIEEGAVDIQADSEGTDGRSPSR